ncbi:heme-binding protein [Evansella sp. AB-rgal1]|uniref:GlcG/HbpS family heme-binding protein n=1 Tax=Evansella sp. AB-rgal1 TaxID=3242696 RepID=UPI00359D5591
MSDQEYLTALISKVVAKYYGIGEANPFHEDYDSIQLVEHLTFVTKKVIEKSNELNVKVSIAVANTTGEPIFFYQTPGSILASNELSKRKAYTAVAMKNSTKALHELVQPNRALYQLETVTDGKIVTFAGGVPLFDKHDRLLGGVGISGAPIPEDDHLLATLFVTEFRKQCFGI